ncbi:hypothetical protein C2E23DRAFT_887017 [Lenzites betulinus]|nr:hypothetical protein C2E23DRAFT_887017 [Lenzites betulinus]
MALCDSFLPHGTYVLLNAKGGTALDMTSKRHVEGHDLHSELNQRWKFINTGNGWAIRNGRDSNDGEPLYLSIKGQLKEGTEIVGSTVPISWYVYSVDGALRITWPNTDYVFDLRDWGDSAPGTKVQLVRLKPGEPCQLWYFSRIVEPDQLDGTAPSASFAILHMNGKIALELENTGRRRVKHGILHKQESQQWRMTPSADGEVIQACRKSLNGKPLYLTVQGPAQQDACIVASPYPVSWRVERCKAKDGKATIRIFWQKTNLVISSQNMSEDMEDVVLADCDDTLLSQWDAVPV